jgi:hypothetical protein
LLIATTLSLNLCGNGQVYNSRRCYEIQPDAMPSRVWAAAIMRSIQANARTEPVL